MEQQRANTSAGGQLTRSTLSLMVPTLRLMSAFAWQVVQHCNVMHYGKVEELVHLVTEAVPNLLSLREKVDILLGLRARPATSGPVSVTDLQTLVWEFISRLDKLLPLPDIKQTAELLGASPSLLEECGQLEFEPAQLKTLLDHHTSQDNAIECSWDQGLGTITSTASSSQSKPPQNHSKRKRKLSPHKTEEDKDGQSDHTYSIDEEDGDMGKQSDDEEWLPLPGDCSPTRVEPDPAPAALMTQAEPSSHAQVGTAVSNNSMAQSWWTCNFTFTRKKRKISNMGRNVGDTLCELVRNHPHLYDATLRKTPYHADTTWNDISRALKLTKAQCRNAWKVKRDRLVKASNKDPEKRSKYDLAIIQRLAWLKPYLKTRSSARAVTFDFVSIDDDMAPELPSAKPSLLESVVSPTEVEPALMTQAEPSSHGQVAAATAVSKNNSMTQSSTSDVTHKKTKYFKVAGFSDTLCELVRKHPNLYNGDVASPLNAPNHVHNAWNDIGRALQLSGQECRIKWKAIRDRFVKVDNKPRDRQTGHDLAILQRLAWLTPYLRKYRSAGTNVPNYDMTPELPSAKPSLLENVVISKNNSMTQSGTSDVPRKRGWILVDQGFSVTLCELVRKHPNLYDPATTLHTPCNLQTTWNDIGRALQLSGKECRRKWKVIRDCFSKSSKKHPLKRTGRDLALVQRLAWLKPYIKVYTPRTFRSAVTNVPNDERDVTPELPSAKPSLLESVVSSWVQSQRTIPSTATSSQSKPQENCSKVKRWTRTGSELLPHRTKEDKDGQSDHSIEEEEGAEGEQRDEEWFPENFIPSIQVEPDTAAWITQPEPGGGSSTQAPEPAALMSQPGPEPSHSQVATAVFKIERGKHEDGSWPGCELVRKHVHLYDGSEPPQRQLQRLSKKCWDSWDEIASTLKSSVNQCKTKWMKIRKRFCLAHNKVPEMQNAADLALIRHLKWLEPYVTHRSGRKLSEVTRGHSTQAELDPAAVTTQPEPSSATAGEEQSHVTAKGRPIRRCSFCGNEFKRKSDLIRHIGTHTRPFACDHCDKRFPYKARLVQHMRLHTGERPHQCTYCGRGFGCATTLLTHVRTHTREGCYTCHICGKKSVQSHVHKRHMLTHEGEKEYLCTECGKAFANNGELMRHTRYHTGERPFPCKLCGKRFAVSGALKIHMRRHTGETPYSCTHCPKAFSTSNARKRHMYIHFAKKPFECSKCGKGFSRMYMRNRHIKSGKCKTY